MKNKILALSIGIMTLVLSQGAVASLVTLDFNGAVAATNFSFSNNGFIFETNVGETTYGCTDCVRWNAFGDNDGDFTTPMIMTLRAIDGSLFDLVSFDSAQQTTNSLLSDQGDIFTFADSSVSFSTFLTPGFYSVSSVQFSAINNFYLDNIVIQSEPAPVPEPTSLALLGLGLAGFGFSRKKKKA